MLARKALSLNHENHINYITHYCGGSRLLALVRAKTRKGVIALIEKFGSEGHDSEVFKNVVKYSDGFDLLDQCNSEGGVYEKAGESERDKAYFKELQSKGLIS
jgi:hypothetical protein